MSGEVFIGPEIGLEVGRVAISQGIRQMTEQGSEVVIPAGTHGVIEKILPSLKWPLVYAVRFDSYGVTIEVADNEIRAATNEEVSQLAIT